MLKPLAAPLAPWPPLDRGSAPPDQAPLTRAQELAHRREQNRRDVAQAKQRYRRETARAMGERGAMGGLLGFLFGQAGSPLGAVIASLVAGGLGAYSAWDRAAREQRGTVQVSLDGQRRSARYYGDPDKFLRTDAELQAELLGEALELRRTVSTPSPRPAGLTPDPRRRAELEPHAATLGALAADRRLVADLGGRLASGEIVLELVSAPEARELLAAGRELLLLEGSAVQDGAPHRCSFLAHNAAGTRAREKTVAWIERTFRYRLSSVAGPQDLAHVPPGLGAPRGFLGVVQGRTELTERVALTEASAEGELARSALGRTQRTRVESSLAGVAADEDLTLEGPPDLAPRPRPNWYKLTVSAGALLGLLAGMTAFPPGSVFLLESLIAGGLAGKKLGDLLVDRS